MNDCAFPIRSVLLIQGSPLWHGTLTLDRLIAQYPDAKIRAVVAPVLAKEFSRRPSVEQVFVPRRQTEWWTVLSTVRRDPPDLALVCYASTCAEEYLKGDTLALLSGAKQAMWIASGGEGLINVGRLIVKAVKRIWKLGVLGMAFYPLLCAAWVCRRVRRGVSTPEFRVFTGERTNPTRAEEGDFQDHLARYLYAQGLTAGGSVLDVGCGDGYGSALLAEKARWVLATDISEEAVRGARRQYRQENLAFAVMDATAPAVAAGRFDMVCAFEVIEHLDNPERFLAQVRHLLRPRGLLLLSTPNKRIFSAGMNAPPNPFHRVEFSLSEFSRLLARYFPRVVLYGMRNRERLPMDKWRYLRGLLKRVDPWNLHQHLSDEMRRWLHRKVASLFGVRAAQDVGPGAYCFENPDPDVSEGFMAVAELER